MATSERKIATTLTLDGEKEYKKALDEAYRGIKVLSSELKLNSTESDKNSKNVDALTQRDKLLRAEIAQQQKAVEVLTKAADEAAQTYGENSKKADEYRIKLNNAKTALANMESALDKNSKQLADAKNKWKAVADGLDSASKKMKSAGSAIENAGNKIKGVSAAAAGAIAAVTKLTLDSGEYADGLITLSAQTSISTETLQEWTYAAKFIDTEVETMTGSMAKMIKRMGEAKDGSKTSAEAFDKLGVKITDSSGNLRDSEDVFMDAIDALGKIQNETERDAASMEMFGKSAQDLNPLIKAGSGELKKYSQEAHDMGVVLDKQSIGKLGSLDDTMQRLKSKFEAVRNEMGAKFAPIVERVGGKITDVIKNIGDKLSGLNDEQIETGLKIAAVVAAAAPLLVITGKVTTAIGGVTKAMSFLAANPVALTITGIVALTAGWMALSKSMQDNDTIASDMLDASKDRIRAVNDARDAYYELKDAQAEQAEKDLAQITNTENLWDELQSLVDVKGRVHGKDMERVDYILDELNSAYGTEYSLVNGMIIKYQDMQTEIDNLIEKKKYEVVQKAALPLYEKAITDEIKLRMDAERDLAALTEAKTEKEALYAQVVERQGQKVADEIADYGALQRSVLGDTELAYVKAIDAVENYEAAYAISSEAVKMNLSDQTSYQAAELLAQQGNWEEAYATLDWYASESAQKYQELQGDQEAQRAFMENEYSLAKSALETYLQNVQNKTEAFNESTLRSLTTNAANAYTKGKDIGANVGDGMITGLNDKKFSISGAIGELSNWLVQSFKSFLGIHSPSTVIDKEIMQDGVLAAIINRLKSSKTAVSKAATETAQSMMDGLSKGQMNLQYALNVQRNFNDVYSSAQIPTQTRGASRQSQSNSTIINYHYTVNANELSYAEQDRLARKSSRNLVRELGTA